MDYTGFRLKQTKNANFRPYYTPVEGNVGESEVAQNRRPSYKIP